ncbi:MAG: phosphoglycerate kinase [Elusimicrobia bacterium]|nr:phosphoglycerate kinase [Elusimicrobiota bacterium]
MLQLLKAIFCRIWFYFSVRYRSSRWPAWLVLLSLVGNQVLFAYEPERSYWEQRRQAKAKRSVESSGSLLARGPLLGSGGGGRAVLPALEKVPAGAHYTSTVSLPPGLGEPYRPYFSAVPLAHATIRKIHLPKNGKPRGLVFHVLDVHRNLDAQTNIAHTVTSLIGLPHSSAIAMVGLEGAFRPYDLSWLRSFPDLQATRVAAEDLLAQDKMSGPMFSLLTAPTAIPPVIGIDDEPHYQANLSAYRRSLATKEADHAHVKNQIKKLESDKTAAFNPELKAFDETVQRYHRGTVSLGIYTRALARKGGPPLAKPIALFLEALEKEESLDFKKVEQQRAGLVESLAQKMNPAQTNELVSRSVSYRAGHLSYGDFYRWIGTLCEDVGVPLSQFPDMAEYIRYVLLSETIDAEDLLAECRRREKILFEQLAKTDDERDLISQSHYMTLVEKLLDFSLTPDEWADYEQVRGRGEEGVNLEPYESFYRQAHARDGAMAENFLGALEKTPAYGTSTAPVSLIVTGGYHGPGLKEKLTQAGIAVVTVVPKIEKIDTTQGSSYLTVFAQEKTPLDKLFEGAKLFVADAPLPPKTAALQATGAALASLTPGDSPTPKVLAFLETHFEGVSVVWEKGIASITLAMFGKQFAVRYDPSQPMGKKIQAGQPSDLNFIQKWFQSRVVDGRLLTIGSALFVAGVWLFIAGPTALHQMGPLLSAIGLLTILHNWTPGGRLVTQSTAVGPTPVRVDPSPVQMASGPEKIGVTAMAAGGKGAPPSRQPGDPWMDLSDIPEGFLRGRTVIVRTNLDDTQSRYDDMRLVLAAKTVRHLTNAGAKVVLLSHRGRPNGFDRNGTLDNRADILGIMVRRTINLLPGDRGEGFRWLSDSDKKAIGALKNGDVVMLQNTRFDPRETSNDPAQRQSMAQELVDLVPDALFVLDGFPIAHRFNTASMDGLAQLLPGVKGLWQSLEEAQHNEFLLRLNSPEDRGKLTVIFGGGKLDKQVEIEAFAREHLRQGDTLIVGGLFSENLLDRRLTNELERRGVAILLPNPAERKLNGKTYEDVGPTFTEKAIEAISNAQTVFWEGPLGRYRDPHSNSLKVAQAITRWTEKDPKRRAFISGGSTSFLFKEANGWDEKKRAQAKGITVSTGGGTSIFYFAHRGRLPGTEGLRGWEPRGHVDLINDPNFWRDILKDPRTFGYVFVVDKNGNYEAHSRRILPGRYGSDLFNDVTQMLILQERINVGFRSTVDEGGAPVPGRFFLTEGHQDFVVFDKDGNPHLLGENENPADRLHNSQTLLAAIQNPDRAKRSGSEPGKTKEDAEKDPGMRVLTAESILNMFPLEVFLVWKSKSGTEWWGTGNRAAYYSNDPSGNPLEQVDHVTFSSSADGKSQSEIGSLDTFRDLMEFLTLINSSNDLVSRPKFRFGGNSWYAKNKDKSGADFKAGASQNVRHAHALRVIFPVEHAPRRMLGQVQNVEIGVLADPENGPGLVLEADSAHLEDLTQVAHRTIEDIIERGHAYNFIIVPAESGFRIFIGDKIQGVPDVRFKNESAFAELGRLMIIDPPELFYQLTPDQMEEIEKLAKEAKEQNKKLNLSPWVKKEKKVGRLEVVDPNLFQDSLAALRSVSVPPQEIADLAGRILSSIPDTRAPPGEKSPVSLDSLLSRQFRILEQKADSRVIAQTWRIARWANDFVAAPIYETALFFLLPAMSGSGLALMVGVLIFVTLHFWDEYKGGRSSVLSHSFALKEAMRRAVPRLWRTTILYAMPFALFMVPSELIPLLQQFGLGSLFSLVQESSLFDIAGTVALLHSGRNFIKTVSVAMMNKFPSLANRKDIPLLFVLVGLPFVAYASSLVETPSLPFLFLAALPWQAILGGLVVAAGVLGGVFLFSRAVSRSGGQEYDEMDAINRILGLGLPHWKVADFLLRIAKETESEVVARAAVLPLIAPWRNLSVKLEPTINLFKERGWEVLVRDISSAQTDPNPNWLSPLAERNAMRIGSAIFLRKPGDLAREQDDLVRYLLEVFPNAHRFAIEQLGSPGLNQINNIGLDLKNQNYSERFGQNLVEFFKDLRLDRSHGELSLPTTGQALARLRNFANKKNKAGSDENKVPVQLEVYTLADIEIARETIRLLQEINNGEENPVRLLLAGADQDAVNALITAAKGVKNVGVALSPVAIQSEENGPWNLETSSLNNQFEGLKGSLGIGDDFALEVSLSETIVVDKSKLESQTADLLNEALKQALLRFIFNEARPVHFNTMLKIIQAIKQHA